MATKLLANYKAIELNKKLHSIIQKIAEDNIITHLRQVILFKDQALVLGTIDDNRFKIWIHEQGRAGVTGIFYPVIEGRSRQLYNGLEITFKSRMNVLGRMVLLLAASSIGYAITTGIVIQENNDLKYLLPRLAIGSILLGLFISVPCVSYFRTSKIIRRYLIKELTLEVK